MKYGLSLVVFFLWVTAGALPVSGAAEEPTPSKVFSADASFAADGAQAKPLPKTAAAAADEYSDDAAFDEADDPFAEERVTIADPLEPVNRVMHQVNDKLYFWALKPAAQGYKVVVPEPARVSLKNFFFNLRYPARLASCLLQTDFKGAATETGRFVINTVWGIGGMMDPAAGGELNLEKQDTDLGQTLGVYGVGHGFYIVWPFYGPSSPRDSVDILGNQVLYPLSFLNIWYASIVTKSVETVNSTSLRIGEYESVIGAAIDPYIAIRNGYIQYRMKEVKARKARSLLFKETAVDPPADQPQETEK